MTRSSRPWRVAAALLVLAVLGTATAALAQFGQLSPPPRPVSVLEFSQQEVQANALVATLNDMSKQHWDVFQITPVWSLRNQNGEAELIPKSYQVFGRRPVGAAQ